MTALSHLGTTPLFFGQETSAWSLATFQNAAKTAKTLGVTSLLVKVADGGNVWYNGLGGWQKVIDAINQQSIQAIPYTYSYGNVYGALQSEIAILIAAMQYAGIVVADMETEYNGHADWASQVCAALKPIPGIFGVTTWADPVQQSWQGVIAALKPCTDFWLPQVYSDGLAAVYQQQFAGLTMYPVLNLGVDFGPNDIVQHAQNAHSPVIAFWEYQSAVGGYTEMIREIVAMLESTGIMQSSDPFAAKHFSAASDQLWHCITPGHLYDVHDAILLYYRQIEGAPRLPLGPEIYGAITGYPECSVQIFESCAVIYDPSMAYDNPGFSGPCYLVKLNEDSPILRHYAQISGISLPAPSPAPASQKIDAALTTLTAMQTGIAAMIADLKA